LSEHHEHSPEAGHPTEAAKMTETEVLEHLAHTPVSARISQIPGRPRLLMAELPDPRTPSLPIASFQADLTPQPDGTVVADAAWLWTNIEGHGLGERLVRGLSYAAREAGATVLDSHLHNAAAAHIRGKVFGDGRLRFYQSDSRIPVGENMTVEEAVGALNLAGSHGGRDDPHIGVRVNLCDVDMTDWKHPVWSPK
jgi:hypothetical protein